MEKLDLNKISSIVSGLIGDFEQVPPAYSAIKYKGKPLYLYARKGQKITLKPRKVKIYDAKILSAQRDEITIEISCSSGTYVRSLAYKIGQKYGCGAIVDELIRVRIGNFTLEETIGLEKLLSGEEEKNKNKPYLMRVEEVLKHRPDLLKKLSLSK